VIALGGAAAMFIGIAALIARLRAHSRQQAWGDWLYRSPASELAARCLELVLTYHWDRFETGKRVVNEANWSDQKLLVVMEDLWVELVRDDEVEGRSGKESNAFVFYDAGLAGICEALRNRLGLPQPWEKTRK
jgi:hypothetical protein